MCSGRPSLGFHWEMLEVYLDACERPLEKSPVLLLAPRSHAKTTIFGESVPLWRLGNNPNELGQMIRLSRYGSQEEGEACRRLHHELR